MNVRVLCLIAASLCTSGCCLPPICCPPPMMSCPPVAPYGMQPMAPPYVGGPAQFRSFNKNITMRPYRAGVAAPRIQPFPPVVAVPPPYHPLRARRVERIRQRSVDRVRQPPAPINYHVMQPNHSKPWKVLSLPKREPRAISIENPFSNSAEWLLGTPCECGCGDGYSSDGCCADCQHGVHCTGSGCGEDLPMLPMTSPGEMVLVPVPESSSARSYDCPDTKKKNDTGDMPAPAPPAPESIDEPPEPEGMADPNSTVYRRVPSYLPAVAAPRRNTFVSPFEDIEDIDSEGSLPLNEYRSSARANSSERRSWVRNNLPLTIPEVAVPVISNPTIASTEVTGHLASFESVNETQQEIQQVSHSADHWQAVELDEGFFLDETSSRHAELNIGREFVPVRRVITRKRK